MQQVKVNTSANLYVYLVDATDGYTPETGVTSPTVYISLNGGAAHTPTMSAWVEISSTNMPGWYLLTIGSAEITSTGIMAVDVYKSGVSRHFATVFQITGATIDDVRTDTATIVADTHTSGVKVASSEKDDIVDKVWDEAISGHLTSGSTGGKLNSASAAADPWAASLPGSYGTDTAGYKIGRVLSGLGVSMTTLTVEDADDNPLDGVKVDVYTSSNPSDATFYTSGTTDINGVVRFYLPAGTWYVFRYKKGYAFENPLTVVVT